MTAATLDPFRVSANRVDKLAACGYGFKLRYVDGVPGQVAGSWALFGSVMHKALESWSRNRSLPLRPLVEQAWLTVTAGTTISDFIGAYGSLSREARKLEAKILRERPDIKQPRLTKDFKGSAVAQQTKSLLHSWLDLLNQSEWRFTPSDPLPKLYDESLILAEAYEARWSHLPPSYVTEFAFEVPFGAFTLCGIIDSIEPMIDRDTGELVGICVIDYKTYGRQPAPMKDWRQLCFYHLAYWVMVEGDQLPAHPEGLPLYVGIDYLRWNPDWTIRPREFWQMDASDEVALSADLAQYARTVQEGIFRQASKNTDPSYCDAGSLCCLNTRSGIGGCAERVEVNV